VPIRVLQICFWLYLLILVWGEATATNPADPDLWHRLALGEALAQTGHFPPGGTFSYLADYHRIADHEWGSALIFYAAYIAGGGAAMVAIKITALAATFVLLVLAGTQGRRRTFLFAAFYALVLLALLPSFQSTVRCVVFTHLFFALWLYWFQRERHGHAVPLWAYLITTVLWANLHGGFAIGLAWLLGLALIDSTRRKQWAIRFALCGLATLINPFGWRLWISTARALLTTRSGFDEWAPVSWWPDLFGFPGYKLLLLLTLAVLAWFIRCRPGERRHWNSIILIAAALALSLTSARHTSIFAAVAGALLPDLFPPEPRVAEMPYGIPRLGYLAFRFAFVLLPFYAALYVLPGDGLALRYPAISCPVAAVDFLQRRNVRGNLLVPFNYGSYALWHLRGRMRVSMDGRYDLVYRPETYRRVEDFFFARGNWPDLLSHPAPAAILLPVSDPVFAKLEARPDWAEAYHDPINAVFIPR
jgi:hypothetical protein